MKLRVAIGTIVWLAFISLSHIHLNVGWAASGRFISGFFTDVQKELQVGFLPVT